MLRSERSTTSSDVRQAARRIKALAAEPEYLRPNGQRKLTYYVALGNIVGGLDSSYGNKVVKELAKAVNQPGLGDNTLNKAARFAQAVEEKRLDLGLLERKGVSWRVASNMTIGHLRVGQRLRLLGRLSSGSIEPRRLGRMLGARLSSTATSTTRSVVTARERARLAILLLQRARDGGHELASQALAELKEML